jgi:hypothetical protein
MFKDNVTPSSLKIDERRDEIIKRMPLVLCMVLVARTENLLYCRENTKEKGGGTKVGILFQVRGPDGRANRNVRKDFHIQSQE